MSRTLAYRFLRSRITLATRELHHEGVLRRVDPKVYDLIVYLIENRHRVVTRAELLEHLWPRVIVTDSVIARCVMLARKSIDGPDEGDSLIRTIHRVGYRFVGDVDVETAPLVAAAPLARGAGAETEWVSSGAGLTRIAFLPFVNGTGEASHSWLELGLPALVQQALEADPRVAMVSTATVLTTLERATVLRTAAQKALHLREVTGANAVISATITRSERGFVLSAEGFCDRRDGVFPPLEGSDVTELALELARSLGRIFFRCLAQDLTLHSSDPFVNECFARAMHAINNEEITVAEKFLNVVVDLEPKSVAARIQYARVLSRLGNDDAFRVASELLEDAEASGNETLAAMTHVVLAIARIECEHDVESARTHVERAITLAGDGPATDWSIEALTLQSRICRLHDQEPCARRACAQALETSSASGNQILQHSTRLEAALIEAYFGDLEAARGQLSDVVRDVSRHGPIGMLPLASMHLATTEGWLGNFASAQGILGDLEDLLGAHRDTMRRLMHPSMEVLQLYCEVRNPVALEGLFARLLDFAMLRETPVYQWYRSYAAGLLELARGALGAAAEHMTAGIEHIQDVRFLHPLRTSVPVLIEVLLKLGQPESAQRWLAFASNLKGFSGARAAQAGLLHCEALAASMRGERTLTRAHLEEAIAVGSQGPWDSYSRLDLAWLMLRECDVARARRLIDPIRGWLAQHPAGLLTGALLDHRMGHFDRASERFEQHLAMVGGAHQTQFAELGTHFRGPMSAAGQVLLQQWTCLPSAYQSAVPGIAGEARAAALTIVDRATGTAAVAR